ncbi:MAG: DUF3078 domain-containing protein [Ignavibacteria bacterium]|nr:DUF3078 domain-containing protein [Ignavibacteria bacterium]
MFMKILFFYCIFSITIFAQEKGVSVSLKPSIGLTYTHSSKSQNDRENLEWLLNLESSLNYASENFHFDSDLFISFGQIVKDGSIPEKTQDVFILNLMPSIKLIDTPSLRLFLQSKAETQLKRGYIDDQETQFLDPLFLTHTIFAGEKKYLIETNEDQELKLTYGIGYSFQQIIKKHYVLSSENIPKSDAEFINGPSAVFNLNFSKQLSEDVSIGVPLNSLFLMKKDFFKSISNSRFSSLLLCSLEFRFLSIQYTNRLVYDKELSNRRQLDQSIVLGLKFTLG